MASTTFEADLRLFVAERGVNESGKFLSESTLQAYEMHLRKWHEKTGAETPTLRLCRSYVLEMADRSVAQSHFAYRALRRYSHWLSTGVSGGTDELAAWKYQVNEEATRTPIATVDDVKALLAVCVNSKMMGVRDHAIISLMAYTGMRRSEVARMEWEHVDWNTGTVFIPKTKAKKPRTVQMPTPAQKSLRRYQRSLEEPRRDWRGTPTSPTLQPFVWVSRQGGGPESKVPLSSNGIQQMLRNRSAEAGVHVPAHALRRFYAVQWLRANGSQAYLQKQAGWADGRMVSKYTAKVAEEESAREAMRIFG